jgi:hypothetical protein
MKAEPISLSTARPVVDLRTLLEAKVKALKPGQAYRVLDLLREIGCDRSRLMRLAEEMGVVRKMMIRNAPVSLICRPDEKALG